MDRVLLDMTFGILLGTSTTQSSKEIRKSHEFLSVNLTFLRETFLLCT